MRETQTYLAVNTLNGLYFDTHFISGPFATDGEDEPACAPDENPKNSQADLRHTACLLSYHIVSELGSRATTRVFNIPRPHWYTFKTD